MNKAEKLIKQCDDINSNNSNWKNYQEEVNSYVIPRKAWVNTPKQTGEKLKFNFLFDSTAIRALKIMAAGFHSNLTNPSTKWFNLRTRDLETMNDQAVQIWFKEVEDIMFGTLSSSNFDTTMQEFYLSVGACGTSAIYTQTDPIEKVRFTEIPTGQLAFSEDASGRVNRMYRSFPLTAQQAFDRWGNKAGKAVLDAYKDKPNDKLDFLHYVGPRNSYNPNKIDNLNMPFESIWMEKSLKHEIDQSGYREFPYSVGRFYKDSTDVMGYAPSMDVLADIKLVNIQVKTMLRAAMKQADPAYILPDKGFILPLNSNPNATNYRREGTSSADIQQLPSNGNIPITMEVIKMVQDGINQAFFVPLFRALSDITKTMTIPEIQRRIAENMVLLGPTVGRFTQDVLDTLLMRVFSILYESGELPPVPEAIQDQDLDIVYISPLAKAQRETEVYSVQSWLGDVVMVAQYKQQALDIPKEDKIVRDLSRIRGINPEYLNSEEDVAEIRKARAEAQAMQAQMEQIKQGADILKTGSEAGKNMNQEA